MYYCALRFFTFSVRFCFAGASFKLWSRSTILASVFGLASANLVASRGVPLEHLTGAIIICGLSAGIAVVALFVVRLPQWWRTVSGWMIVGAGALVIASHGPVSRQALNLITYVLVAGPIWWASREGIGNWRLPTAVVVSVVWPVCAIRDVRIPVVISKAEVGGIFRFYATWPDENSSIDHRMHWDRTGGLAPSAVGIEVGPECDSMVRLEGWVVKVGSEAGQTGSLVVVDGLRHLGFARRASPESWIFRLEQDDWTADGDLTLRIRLNPFSSDCRLLAMRWTAGASGGVGASAVVSGGVSTAGVFDPASGAVRAGVLLIRPIEIDAVR